MAERIRARMKELRTTARAISMKTTGKPDFLRPVLEGASPRADNLEKLATALSVSVNWLLTGEGPAPDSVPPITVPLQTWVQAGVFALEDGQQEQIGEVAIGDLDPRGDWIALEVRGDSMDRISPPGSIICVDRKDTELVPNACYVLVNGAGETTYKRFRTNPMRFEPVSTNPAHEPLYPDEPPVIVGRVKETRLRM